MYVQWDQKRRLAFWKGSKMKNTNQGFQGTSKESRVFFGGPTWDRRKKNPDMADVVQT